MNSDSSLNGSGDSTNTGEDINFKRYLKYRITFKKIINNESTAIIEFKNISINSVRFKISKNGYNSNDDVAKEYLFKKIQDYYTSNNNYDYGNDGITGPEHEYNETYIGIDKIIINNNYKFIGFNINHPSDPDNDGKLKIIDSEFDENELPIFKTYLINIEIILKDDTKIVILNNNKYTRLLKLLKKHLNSRNTNINTLYHDLLKKMQQENTLNVTTNSIININSLLKLLSEYLGINSKNPNVLYHSLLVKK